ncbi:MAG: ABC transporter substrate-binding protein [Rhodospirillaceae bacterium]|jgi:glycine betaine/proline transport system substrate-binding protein|nr:ABC transporter substrate-binding protein [Rhodospirillaceae bacterium]MBT5242101.1 ABC transporter substrate-binding protein [Rhodospirillaceae bacterium]MBT5565827.1 ABC transporter substrate-binding protein [Rhodospirillaceae bacterium]MBT6090280.1 ABC transporter substrate-binding protein [Rhodospirillaceae bacterium]MBT6961961.1 ABC transporter substrate-binding protein [Rhodospirillaceae bacterium]
MRSLFQVLILVFSTASASACDVDRPVVFAGLDWQSNAFHTAVAQFILEAGHDCKTDVLPGTTIPLLQGVAQGDIDIVMEVWKDNVTEVWNRGLRRKQVVEVGTNFPDAVQGWYVPRYMVVGEDAIAPGLISVADLPAHKTLFTDPEEPDKGRFYNCIAGWNCEVINSAKLKAYGLDADFTNFRPGTGAALAAAIASSYIRKKPIVTYYWGPTWVLGKYDMVMLEEPPFDADVFADLVSNPNPVAATAYPVVEVAIGANRNFSEEAPSIISFLTRYHTDAALVSAALAYMEETGGQAEDAAHHFLRTRSDIWTTWVDELTVAKVTAALARLEH